MLNHAFRPLGRSWDGFWASLGSASLGAGAQLFVVFLVFIIGAAIPAFRKQGLGGIKSTISDAIKGSFLYTVAAVLIVYGGLFLGSITTRTYCAP